jgi:hypothetical protein
MDEEENFFIKRVSDANVIMIPVIQEFVIRVLQRMFYGMSLVGSMADERDGAEGQCSIPTIATTSIYP